VAQNDAREKRVRAVELIISNLLRYGVAISFITLVSGVTLSFIHHPEYVREPATLAGVIGPGASFPTTIPGILRGVRAGSGQAVILLGLLVLISTPVLRVAVSIVAFAYERDRVFVVITSVVLALLLTSFLIGKAGG
jgi:uncharacterized membrane protein